jgi:hypothetical protein
MHNIRRRMRIMRRTIPTLVPVLVLLLSAGCGSSIKSSGEADATDTPSEPGPDISIDLPPTDAIPDPVTDTGTPDIGVDTAPGEGVVGDPCTDASNCMGVPTGGRTCLITVPMGGGYELNFPGGYCSGDCMGPGDCGPGGDCVDFWGYGVCLKSCTSDGECRTAEGYVCYSIPYVTTETYCVPYM